LQVRTKMEAQVAELESTLQQAKAGKIETEDKAARLVEQHAKALDAQLAAAERSDASRQSQIQTLEQRLSDLQHKIDELEQNVKAGEYELQQARRIVTEQAGELAALLSTGLGGTAEESRECPGCGETIADENACEACDDRVREIQPRDSPSDSPGSNRTLYRHSLRRTRPDSVDVEGVEFAPAELDFADEKPDEKADDEASVAEPESKSPESVSAQPSFVANAIAGVWGYFSWA
jgi:uncharacterized protein (DUF3084 family)